MHYAAILRLLLPESPSRTVLSSTNLLFAEMKQKNVNLAPCLSLYAGCKQWEMSRSPSCDDMHSASRDTGANWCRGRPLVSRFCVSASDYTLVVPVSPELDQIAKPLVTALVDQATGCEAGVGGAGRQAATSIDAVGVSNVVVSVTAGHCDSLTAKRTNLGRRECVAMLYAVLWWLGGGGQSELV
ncbi:hypothetical protein K461DRAFT_33263 [Myriangium duriaei CBS 260.36]|uniref:Uncharacterized protein n=1 Tax=Myriangium duriaei CBS 260.36 TaxID=1168546 RepID=A0A9P4MDB7_9PEZI|nr:hypothetical protein K461DRAFT_33263 [Myriangium duriaei CBS 260.36]